MLITSKKKYNCNYAFFKKKNRAKFKACAFEHHGERSWAEIVIACLRVCLKEIVPICKMSHIIVCCSTSVNISAVAICSWCFRRAIVGDLSLVHTCAISITQAT